MHSATASGPNSVNAGLHLVTLRSNQACRTKDLSKWSVDVCQWSTPNLFQKENVKCPKKSMAAVLTLLFDHFQTSMTKYSHLLVAIIYIHSFCPVCTHLLCRPKAKDEMRLLPLSPKGLLGQCCRVHVALQSRDKIQDLRRRPSCKHDLGMDVQPNVSNHQKCPTGMMANSEV